MTETKEDFRAKAAEELLKIKQDCQERGVVQEIKNIREYVDKAGISLADIGTSEEELQTCFKTGNMNAARTWLKRARERSVPWEVDTRGHIRRLAAEASFTLADIGTSEEELQTLYEEARKEAIERRRLKVRDKSVQSNFKYCRSCGKWVEPVNRVFPRGKSALASFGIFMLSGPILGPIILTIAEVFGWRPTEVCPDCKRRDWGKPE